MTNLLLKPMVLAPRATQSALPCLKKPLTRSSQLPHYFHQDQPAAQPPNQQTTIHLPRGNLELTYQTSSDYQLDDLLGFAQRINPKRAFLFVSKVLGRHIPVAPSTMRQAFTQLAGLLPDNLPEPVVVIGMAETAVGLAAGVHQALQTRYPKALLLNSTRHAQPDATLLTTFSEDHSHASNHLIYQSDAAEIQQQLLASKTLIMVDDEASTGNTCVNVVNALRDAGLGQLEQVHLTTLVDWSLGQSDSKSGNRVNANDSADDAISRRFKGIEFQRHHLLAGDWTWTDAPNPAPILMPRVDTTAAGSQPILATGHWGRQPTLDSTEGFAAYLAQFQKLYCQKFSRAQWQEAPLPPRILVLGSNEFVWLPFLLAQWLEDRGLEHTGLERQASTAATAVNTAADTVVKCGALTRSPIALGGAIETRLSFKDNYGLGMTNFVYNVDPKQWDLIVLCVETPSCSVDSLWQDLDNVLVVSPA